MTIKKKATRKKAIKKIMKETKKQVKEKFTLKNEPQKLHPSQMKNPFENEAYIGNSLSTRMARNTNAEGLQRESTLCVDKVLCTVTMGTKFFASSRNL